MKILTLKNLFLLPITNPANPQEIAVEALQDWLTAQPLKGARSRLRTRFVVQKLMPRMQEMDKVKGEMLGRYTSAAWIDGDGLLQTARAENAPKDAAKMYLDAEGFVTFEPRESVSYALTGVDFQAFQAEYAEYIGEDFIIDYTPESAQMIDAVKATLLETEDKFERQRAFVYDQWCDAFESIAEDKTDTEKPLLKVV